MLRSRVLRGVYTLVKVVVVVVVSILTRIIKSVVKGQLPVTLQSHCLE